MHIRCWASLEGCTISPFVNLTASRKPYLNVQCMAKFVQSWYTVYLNDWLFHCSWDLSWAATRYPWQHQHGLVYIWQYRCHKLRWWLHTTWWRQLNDHRVSWTSCMERYSSTVWRSGVLFLSIFHLLLTKLFVGWEEFHWTKFYCHYTFDFKCQYSHLRLS